MTVAPACPIVVSAETRYVSEQSDPGRDRYVFAYTITIRNAGTVAARLVSRHWVITDATGKVEEVRGDGVVGEQPLIRSGESYRYTSGAAIATPVGTMQGSYRMTSEDGMAFDAPIPAFTLAMPRVLH